MSGGEQGVEEGKEEGADSSNLDRVQAPLELCHDMRLKLTWWEKLTKDIFREW